MKSHNHFIGGFFELETNFAEAENGIYHKNALALSNGRACLNFICQKTPVDSIYIPFYTCDTILEPLLVNNVNYVFYSINIKLEIDDTIKLKPKDYILYINYFGLKSQYCQELKEKYGPRLIVDNTQAFFEKGFFSNWSFNSVRKFFGVPDGAYLYGPNLEVDYIERNPFYQCKHLLERKYGNLELAYKLFVDYENTMKTQVYYMSQVSENLLKSLDLMAIANKRKNNFLVYRQAFEKYNILKIDHFENDIPFAYPLLLNIKVDKLALANQNIFIPSLWNEVVLRKASRFVFESQLASNLLTLPVDHRYEKMDCEKVIDAIKRLI